MPRRRLDDLDLTPARQRVRPVDQQPQPPRRRQRVQCNFEIDPDDLDTLRQLAFMAGERFAPYMRAVVSAHIRAQQE